MSKSVQALTTANMDMKNLEEEKRVRLGLYPLSEWAVPYKSNIEDTVAATSWPDIRASEIRHPQHATLESLPAISMPQLFSIKTVYGLLVD